jgi:allantoinase
MNTLLIKGGTLVSERTITVADVLAVDGRVAAVLPPGQDPPADQMLDARGLHVLPGMVDAHVHFNEPGRTDWEGFRSGTTAAAAGGVTTICDMPLNSDPPTLDARALASKRAAVAPNALVDYAFWGGVVPASLPHLADLSGGGVVGIKGFLCDSGLPEFPALTESDLREAMQRCAEHGLLLALHAEDHAATHQLGAAARAAGRRTPRDWARARPPATEHQAVAAALDLARATGARLHFVHISTAGAARLIAAAKTDGVDVSVETCPHYLLLDEDDFDRLGTIGKCAPPLRAASEVADLWAALADGTIDWVASDHSPCPPELKSTSDIWTAWGGVNGVQTSLAALLSEGPRYGLRPTDIVRLTSANPARGLGLYPRKGALEVGSDADVALVDFAATWTLAAHELRTRWPLSPFLGRAFQGRVVRTLVRGATVWANTTLHVEAGFGQEVPPSRR